MSTALHLGNQHGSNATPFVLISKHEAATSCKTTRVTKIEVPLINFVLIGQKKPYPEQMLKKDTAFACALTSAPMESGTVVRTILTEIAVAGLLIQPNPRVKHVRSSVERKLACVNSGWHSVCSRSGWQASPRQPRMQKYSHE
jgi:hypothetical protein